MDPPIFSQIPTIVLEKINHELHTNQVCNKKRKRLTWNHEITKGDEENTILETKKVWQPDKTQAVIEPKEFQDAIIQVDLSPDVFTRGTQTDETCLKSSSSISYESQYKNQLEMNSLSVYRPLYSFGSRNGRQPPLKIGLSLPKGKKRKVFYPDEQD